MKAQIPLLALLLIGLLARNAAAITRYVDLNSTSPTPPYTGWSTAATNINDAIDAASMNDLILVTNGVYQTGGRVVTGTMTNRVAVTKPVIVSSVNGPAFTIIQGAFDPLSNSTGDNAVQGVYLASAAVLSGFTITNGATQDEFWGMNQIFGGGVWCESTNAIVTNCVIAGNISSTSGGGVYRGTIKNSILSNNMANVGGGGAFQSILVNCLLYANSAKGGGGANESTLINCTVTHNSTFISHGSSPLGAGVAQCVSYNSIIYYNTNENGNTDYANYNRFFDNLSYCCTTPLPSAGINITDDPLFVDAQNGNLRLLSNSPCANAGDNSYALPGFDLDGNPRIIDAIVDMGAFEAPTNLYVPTTIYVDVNGTNPIPPYTNWSTAATVLQDAADVSQKGDEILVAPGVYRTGGRLMDVVTNRVVLMRSVSLRSTHGPTATVIEGFQVPDTGYGESAIRGAYLWEGTALIGFTITNGATGHSGAEGARPSDLGGGIWCVSTSAVITNCVIVNNKASGGGGGTYQGTVQHSLILSNSGASSGGGALGGILQNCIIQGNSAGYGGGVNASVSTNCLVIYNTAQYGGGAIGATLGSCTVSANAAWEVGGAYGCTLENSIVHGNTASAYPNHFAPVANYSCTYPLPENGTGNFTNPPLFINSGAGNFRLQTNSPCIDSGNNASVSLNVDLDGRQRITGASVDIGAYEFLGAGMGEFIGWLQGFGLSTDGSADFIDADDDRMNNYSEWRSDTVPTNSLSVLHMVSATNGVAGAHVTWQSVPTRNYTLERSTNLASASPFQIIATSIAGTVGTKTFIDSSATNSGPYFYRVGVE